MSNIKKILELIIFEYHNFKLTIGSIFLLVGIWLVVLALLKLAKFLIHRKLAKKGQTESHMEHTVYQLLRYFLFVIAIVVWVETIGVDVTVLIGGAAALLVGLGLGLQGLFQDIVSGIVLLFEGTFKIGDVIEIGDMVCRVKDISLRTSKVETREGIMIIVPNSKLISENLINWTHNYKDSRFHITVGVAYGSDTELVTKILRECAKNHPYVTQKQDIFVKFEDFGDSALIFKLFFWSDFMWGVEIVKSELRYAIDKAFRENKVTIPFPQRDIHIVSGYKD